MRVLMVNKFYDLRGGTERMMFDLTAGLRDRGHHVVPFSMEDPRNEPTPYRRYFVPLRDYDATGAAARVRYAMGAIYDTRARRHLGALLDHEPADVAHLHNIYHQLSPSLLGELRRRRVPTLMTLHDYKLACPTYRLFRDEAPCTKCVGKKLPLWAGVHTCSRGSRAESWLLAVESSVHRLARLYERGVDRFVAPSRFLADLMARHGLDPHRIEVIPNAPRGVDDPAPWERRAGSPRVLFAGRLSVEKGVGVLIEAARRVPDVEVVIAGEGPESEPLRRQASGLAHVRFAGRLGARELAQERALAWAMALPSTWYENAPLSLLEAYASGRPVVAAAHGGLVEMVRENETGWLVPPADVPAWEGTLRRVVREQECLGEMGRAARAHLEERYGFEDCVAAYERLYRELAG